MIVFKRKNELQAYLHNRRKQNQSIGFVPTMGALHQGHISLIEQAKKETDCTVCSIFVNPAQFNDPQDFDKYPSSIAEDIILLESSGCDILFLPDVAEIYPLGMEAAKEYDFGFLETVFEGAQRPGHFKGVGKVVAILLEIVQPDALFMGSKDYQQCLVVQNLCQQMGLDKILFVACPTKREPDGLAMSSRNRRLSEVQRTLSGILYQCLVSIQAKFLLSADFSVVQKECIDLLQAKNIEPEYVSIANAETLEPLSQYQPNTKMIALIAAKIGSIRLIDNLVLN